MIIIGAGGHGKVLAEILLLRNISDFTFIDDDLTKLQTLGKKVHHIYPNNYSGMAVIGIGNNEIRKNISNQLNIHYRTLIHPNTHISQFCQIGAGTVAIAGATINIDAKIGKHVIVNTNASVGHDCTIGDFVHIAPNVALAGNVQVGEGTHIGIGSAVIQGIKIGAWCTIGAGTVVIKDVPDGATVVGNPGQVISIKEKALI